MMVTDSEYCYFVVLLLARGRSFIIERVDRNDEFIGLMRKEEVSFWTDNVLKLTPPDPDTIEDAKSLYTHSVPDSYRRITTNDILHKYNLLKETVERERELKKVSDNLKKDIMVYMEDNEIMTDMDDEEVLVT